MGVKVSIIMPSFNVAPYIRECMDSVLNQTLRDIEVIVVDADSTDGTREILDEYARKDDRIRVLKDDKKSTGYANNKAIEQANGEYIGIVETDDYVMPDMYQTLYETAKRENCDVVKSDYQSFSGDGDDRMFIKRNLWMDIGGEYERLIDPMREKYIFDAIMFNWAGIYRRSFLEKYHIRHQETPGASFQDNGFYFQTLAFAERVWFVKQSFYRYRRDNPNSSINNPNKVFCMCDEYDFIERILKEYPDKWDAHYFGYMRRRYGACSWTLKKVLPEYRQQLANRMHDDLVRLLRSENDLDRIPREEKYKIEMKLLYEDTDRYLDELFQGQDEYGFKAKQLCDEIWDREIFIFGCGECGTNMDCLLKEHGLVAKGYIDNNADLQGTEFNHKRIYACSDIAKDHPNCIYLSTIQDYWNEIRKQLVECGVPTDNIIDINIRDYIWD